MSKSSTGYTSYSNHLPFIIWLLVTFVLWGFIGIHAFSMDITHDEAYSFGLVKANNFRAMPGTANTHWLNSFFMKVSSMLLGNEPGFLRLHSVLAFPFFSWGIWKLSPLIPQKPLQYIFCALALFNPYVLDFFALARGYGMAVTFQVWVIIFFVKAAGTTFHYKLWLKVWLLNALILTANLSYFYTMLPVAIVFVVFTTNKKYRLKQTISKQEWIILLLFALTSLFAIADLLFIKYYGNDLRFGGTTDLIGSLFGTVWNASLYFSPLARYTSWIAMSSFILLCVAFGWYGIQLYRQRGGNTGFLLCVPIAGIVVLNVLFHLVLKSPFLFHRTALQWYIPGMVLLSFFFGERMTLTSRLRFIPVAISALVIAALAIHYYTRTDKRFCFEWYLHGNTKQSLYGLYEKKPQHPLFNARMKVLYVYYYHLLDSTLTPLPKFTPQIDVITSTNRALVVAAAREADYMLIAQPAVQQILEEEGVPFSVLQTYPVNNNKLVLIRH